jgi:hypothetical protein
MQCNDIKMYYLVFNIVVSVTKHHECEKRDGRRKKDDEEERDRRVACDQGEEGGEGGRLEALRSSRHKLRIKKFYGRGSSSRGEGGKANVHGH